MTKGPVLIDLEGENGTVTVVDAPPVPDAAPETDRAAMQVAAQVAARPPTRLGRWFWGLALAGLGALVSIATWDYVTGLVARSPVLGWGVSAIFAALLFVLVVIAIRELAAFARLGRIDALRQAADNAAAETDLEGARKVAAQLVSFYGGREETRWGRDRVQERIGEQFDADAVLSLAEQEILVPLDNMALREVEAASRQVATVTALVPLALADVVVALTSSLRMIRRVAEIYGGRSGLLGSWRLTRAVFTHLVATGAVAVGDDVLEPVLGGSILSKISRRFGEGLVNGALSARVGVAAMEVCRPLPFGAGKRPSVRGIVQRALRGLFSANQSK